MPPAKASTIAARTVRITGSRLGRLCCGAVGLTSRPSLSRIDGAGDQSVEGGGVCGAFGHACGAGGQLWGVGGQVGWGAGGQLCGAGGAGAQLCGAAGGQLCGAAGGQVGWGAGGQLCGACGAGGQPGWPVGEALGAGGQL